MKKQYKIVIAVVAGVVFGLLFAEWHDVWGAFVESVGQVFLRLLGMIVLPLIFISTVLSVSKIDSQKSVARIALSAFLFFIVTSLIAAVVGIAAAEVIRPGVGAHIYTKQNLKECVDTIDLKSVDIGVVEMTVYAEADSVDAHVDSINSKSVRVTAKATKVVACGDSVNTKTEAIISQANTAKDKSWLQKIVEVIPANVFSAFSEGNILSIILFALLFGFFVTKITYESREVVNNFFVSLKDVIMKMTDFVIQLAPFGIFAIIMNVVGEISADPGNMSHALRGVLFFVIAVLAGLSVMWFAVLPAVLGMVTKSLPFSHFRKISGSIMWALSTCSSYTAMPYLVKETHEKCGVSQEVADFTISLGIVFNKVGTIIYECVAVIFVAQMTDCNLDLAQHALLIVLSIVMVLSAPNVPMAGVVVLTMLLQTFGLSLEYIGIFYAIDILCDAPKTALNTYSMGCAAVVVAKRNGETLDI